MSKKEGMRTDYVRLKNSRTTDIKLCLEPWGDQISMPPNVIFDIVAYGPEESCMQIIFGGDDITLYGWTGSVVHVFYEGKKLAGYDLPVPPTPPYR